MITTNKANNGQHRHTGINAGKTFLDIYIIELDRHGQVHNTSNEIKQLTKPLNRFNLTRIVVEATEDYERQVVEAGAESEVPVIFVQPMNMRHN